MSSSSSSSRSSSSASTQVSAPYCTEQDLLEERPQIMNYGVATWDDKIVRACEILDRDLDVNWYRGAAENLGVDWRQYPFDPTLLFNSSTVQQLAVFKTLELCYRHLAKDAPPDQDAFTPQSRNYRKLYSEELKDACAAGLDYDWDGSGGLTYEETGHVAQRRLTRC
jgi:hypothetical protein